MIVLHFLSSCTKFASAHGQNKSPIFFSQIFITRNAGSARSTRWTNTQSEKKISSRQQRTLCCRLKKIPRDWAGPRHGLLAHGLRHGRESRSWLSTRTPSVATKGPGSDLSVSVSETVRRGLVCSRCFGFGTYAMRCVCLYIIIIYQCSQLS